MKLFNVIIFVIFCFSGILAQYPHDSAWIPTPPVVMPQPEYLQSVLEEAYNIDITRISDAAVFGVPDGGGELTHSYSKVQAWNADMTKISIGFTNVLNADDYTLYKNFTNAFPEGFYNDSRWSNVDPDIRYFCWGDKFLKINIETEVVDTLHVFNGYDTRIGPFEGNISADDKYVVITDFTGHNATLYDIENDMVISSKNFPGAGFDWTSITPSNDYIAVSNNTTGNVELYDLDFNFIKVLVYNQQHADFATDAFGNEVLVQVIPLSMTRLEDGFTTDLIDSALVCGNYNFNPNIAGHISGRNLNNPGWALASTQIAACSNGNGYYYITEMFAIKLDGSGTIRHFGHAYTSTSDYDTYSKATISPDGSKVIYSSDWNLYGNGNNTSLAYLSEVHTPLSKLSDEFDNVCSKYDWENVNTTEGWNASHLETQDVNVTNEGQLTLMPWTTAWYANYRSNLMYKEVANDFVFTTYVSATNRAENDMPGALYSLAGAMVRTEKSMTDGINDWVAGQENYIFLSLGFASTNHSSCSGCPGPHFEVKSTTNSSSNLNVTSIDTAAALIRIIKINDAIIVLHQVDGQNFEIVQRYSRPDMPNTVQVGLVAYTDWNKVYTYTNSFHNSHTLNANLNPDPSSNQNLAFNPDIIAKFDYARFEEPQIPANMIGLNFADANEVSDVEILNLFGYTSISSSLKDWKIWQGTNTDWSNPTNWSGGTIPTMQDSILIPNCDCPEIVFPIIPNNSFTYSSLIIEDGGQVTINNGVSLNINLTGSNARFINRGTIINEGLVSIANTQNKISNNIGLIVCKNGGSVSILE
ncbi:MAG: hypothetical protein V3V14_14480 [Saprospiraceae bacterium]